MPYYYDYTNQLNTIIGNQEDIYQEQQKTNEILGKINNTVSVALGLIIVIGIVRHRKNQKNENK